MKYVVYKITNSINGFIYIGATRRTIEIRFEQHCNNKNQRYPLCRDMNIYGRNAFSVEVVEECIDQENMAKRESYWISYYSENMPDLLYNIYKTKKPFTPTFEYMQMCNEIKSHLNRNQKWLARQIGMREPVLCDKINDKADWTQDDLDKINKVLGTSFKL